MGECTPTPSGGIACGIECDGGGEDNAADPEAGRDDRTFRLDPVPETRCLAYETW